MALDTSLDSAKRIRSFFQLPSPTQADYKLSRHVKHHYKYTTMNVNTPKKQHVTRYANSYRSENSVRKPCGKETPFRQIPKKPLQEKYRRITKSLVEMYLRSPSSQKSMRHMP
jgi:hypothetical protein